MRRSISSRAVVVILFLIASCSDSGKSSSIWYGNVEILPGFITPFEFELSLDPATKTWVGKFQLVELMAAGQFTSVIVTDSLITMELGGGVSVSGMFDDTRQRFDGNFKLFDTARLKVAFEKNDNWTFSYNSGLSVLLGGVL